MRKLKNIFLLFLCILCFSCSFFTSFTEEPSVNINLSFDKTKTSVSLGSMDIINLKTSNNQNNLDIRWIYDDSIIMAKTDNYGAVITGLKPGTTQIKAVYGSNSATCLVTVSNDTYAVNITNPYIYASTDIVDVKPNQTVKISASLFGGTMADINGYSFSIDNPSIASLSTEGNYCWITGLNSGMAKVTIRHTKAAFNYSVLVNCSNDGTNVSYITSKNNIITINLSENNKADFEVELKNPLSSEYFSAFTFEVVDTLGNPLSDKPVDISLVNGLNVSLTAIKAGQCYVRCKHPDAIYDFDILVRVIENAETAYIEPSTSLVTVSNNTETISVDLVNYSGQIEEDLFTWSFSENASEYIEYTLLNGTTNCSAQSELGLFCKS